MAVCRPLQLRLCRERKEFESTETGELRHQGLIQCDAKMEQPAKNNLRVKAFFDSLNNGMQATAYSLRFASAFSRA
jgi:hypothetical protein